MYFLNANVNATYLSLERQATYVNGAHKFRVVFQYVKRILINEIIML